MCLARIVVGDPQDLIVEGLRHILEPLYEIVAGVTDGSALLNAALSLRPDLIAADIGLFRNKGKDWDLLQRIRTHLPQAKLLCLVPDAVWAASLRPEASPEISAGTVRYVLKNSPKQAIIASVNQALAGVTPTIPNSERTMTRSGGLTSRQHAILQMIADGKSSKEMAYELNISVRTVEFHRANLRTQLGVRSTAELTKRAMLSTSAFLKVV